MSSLNGWSFVYNTFAENVAEFSSGDYLGIGLSALLSWINDVGCLYLVDYNMLSA